MTRQTGEAANLVRNLNTLNDIWERLGEKYGDTMEIVDTVIQEIKELVIPKGGIHQDKTRERSTRSYSYKAKRRDS